MKKKIYQLTVLIFICSNSYSDSIEGEVIKIIDGDTIHIRHNSKTHKVRLAYIDCPEIKQKYGRSVSMYLSDMIRGKIVLAQIHAIDQYNRLIAEIFYDNKNINLHLIEKGKCLVYRRYAKGKNDYFIMESMAKKSQIGLHSDSDFLAPWLWRRSN